MVGPSLDTTKLHLKPSAATTTTTTIKFLCSYGGKIIPRHPDGKLRYHGGETRVLAVGRSISFAELLMKLGELCGATVSLRCQLPEEDLDDALVSITSDEDLANLIEEYDRAATPTSSLKIRAFLSLPKKLSPPSSSSASSASSSSSSNSYAATIGSTSSTPKCYRHQISKPVAYPARKNPHYGYHAHGIPGHVYLIHNGNHWQ